MCGKGSGRHKAEKTKNPGVAGGGNFGKKSCSGKSVFLTKAFLWVPFVFAECNINLKIIE
jgi:hypothetical protein